jgi:hypothetical protein
MQMCAVLQQIIAAAFVAAANPTTLHFCTVWAAVQVGVGIHGDVRRIAADYGVVTRSAVDLADVAAALAPQLLLTQQQQGTAAAAAAAAAAAGASASAAKLSSGGASYSLAGLCRLLLGVEVDKALQVGRRQRCTIVCNTSPASSCCMMPG